MIPGTGSLHWIGKGDVDRRHHVSSCSLLLVFSHQREGPAAFSTWSRGWVPHVGDRRDGASRWVARALRRMGIETQPELRWWDMQPLRGLEWVVSEHDTTAGDRHTYDLGLTGRGNQKC